MVFHKSEEFYILDKDDYNLSSVHSALCEAFSNIGDYSNALQYAFKALAVLQKSGNIKDQAVLYQNIGATYSYTGNYAEALESEKNALKIYQQLGDSAGISYTYNNLGAMYTRMMNMEQALAYFKRAMDISLQLKDEYNIAAIHLNKSELFVKMKNYAEALTSVQLAIPVFTRLNDVNTISEILNDMADIYYCTKQYKQAKEKAEDAIRVAKKSRHLEDLKLAYYTLSKVDSAQGNYSQAFGHYKLYAVYKDSLLNEENIKKIVKTQLQLTYDKKAEIDSLEIEKEKAASLQKINLKNIEISRQQLKFNLSLLVAFVLLGAIVMAIVFNLRLRKQKKIIEEKNNQYDVLLREIHHRVKNNLQVISSMLELESRKLIAIGKEDLLTDMKSRISTISLVHTILYNQKEMVEISAGEYFRHLLETIKKILEKPGTQSSFILNIDPLLLKTDSLIPLGLIVTELITNSYKYAVDGNNKLTIELEIVQLKDKFKLSYFDSGPGLISVDTDIEKNSSLGMRLIKLLTKQISGSMKIINQPGRFGYEFIFNVR